MNLHTLDLAQAPTEALTLETLTRGLRCQDCCISDGSYDLRFNTAAPNFAPGFAEAYAERFRARLDRWRTIAHKLSAGFLHCAFEDPLEALRKDFGARWR